MPEKFMLWGLKKYIIPYSLVKIRLHTRNQLPRVDGSALQVHFVQWGGVGSTQLCGL